MTSRPSTAAPILAVLAVVLVTLGAGWTVARAADKPGDDRKLVAYLKEHREEEDAGALFRNLVVDREFASQGKDLVLTGKYTNADGQQRYVFVYDPNLKSWPGTQPQTIVIADAEQRLIVWREVGGSPMLLKAELDERIDDDLNKKSALVLTHEHRHSFKLPDCTSARFSRSRFSLEEDEIAEPQVEGMPTKPATK